MGELIFKRYRTLFSRLEPFKKGSTSLCYIILWSLVLIACLKLWTQELALFTRPIFSIGLHSNTGSDGHFCKAFGKEMTLIWREGRVELEQAFSAHHDNSWKHENVSKFLSNLNSNTVNSLTTIQTFGLYLPAIQTVIACMRRWLGYVNVYYT